MMDFQQICAQNLREIIDVCTGKSLISPTSTLGKWEQKQKCCVIQLKEILFIFFFIHQFVFRPFISCFIVCINKNTGVTVTENQENSKNNLNY